MLHTVRKLRVYVDTSVIGGCLDGGTREMPLSERSTGVSPVEDVRLGAGSAFFRGQDARAPLFRGCLDDEFEEDSRRVIEAAKMGRITLLSGPIVARELGLAPRRC